MTASSTDQPRRAGVLIAGMHRSGTSAFTRVLNLHGADLAAHLVAATPSNISGHWESAEFLALNREILAAHRAGWDDWRAIPKDCWRSAEGQGFKARAVSFLRGKFPDAALFALKDPRVCRVLDLWIEALCEAGVQPYCIMPLRHPLEVAKSLARRDGLTLQRGLMIWLGSVLDAEAQSRGVPRAFLLYDSLLRDWRQTMRKLAEDLGLALPAEGPQVAAEVDCFLERKHRNISLSPAAAAGDTPLARLAVAAFDALVVLTERPFDEDALGRLDAIGAEFDGLRTGYDGFFAECFDFLLSRDGAPQQIFDPDGTRSSALDGAIAALVDGRSGASQGPQGNHDRDYFVELAVAEMDTRVGHLMSRLSAAQERAGMLAEVEASLFARTLAPLRWCLDPVWRRWRRRLRKIARQG